MENDIAIKVEKVYKNFKLPHHRKNTVKSIFTSVFDKTSHQKSYEVQHALKDVSFEIIKGEFFGIVGRNGSGKSTLLKMLAGIYQPTKGSIQVRGKLVPFIELGVGFNPELTGRENVYMNGAILGFAREEIDAFYDEVVKFAELEKFMDQKLKNYSSGMQVRLAFSMAIRAKADTLLIDEVLAVGDADFQQKCYSYFKTLKKDKKTVVFVSHDMGAVQQFCDRALLLEASKIVKVDQADKISVMYNKLFMGTAADTIPTKSGEERWGDGSARWKSVIVSLPANKPSEEPEYIEISCVGKANKDIVHPIFGFSIKNQEFNQLLGTNTVRQHKKIRALKKNQTFEVKWRVRNVLNKGRYYVDCTVAQDQASLVCDRWPEAAEFNIKRLEDNPYLLYPAMTCIYNDEV